MHLSNTFLNFYLIIEVTINIFTCGNWVNAKDRTTTTAIIKQSMFTQFSVNTNSIYDNINMEAPNGNSINILPSPTMEQLIRLQKSVVPHIELKDSSSKDAIKFVFRKPKPRTVSLGLIYTSHENEKYPAWLNDLSVKNEKIQCIATNVSLLNLAFVFADIFDCEFGITVNGEVMFRNKTTLARTKYPFYTIKPKHKESDINKRILPSEINNNIFIGYGKILFVASVFLLITIIVVFFKKHNSK